MTDPIKAEPVAWMYSSPHGVETTPDRYAEREGYTASNWRGWTETPLYTAAQLEAARQQGWNEAIEAAETLVTVYLYPILSSPTRSADWHRAKTAINTAIRALTKDSTND